jgi:hypothetical protein
MTRSLVYLTLAAMIANAPGSCAKADANQSAAATGGGSGASGGDWTSLGATACAKYLTPDVVSAILSQPAGPPKTLSPQACSVTSTDEGGSISITLTAAGAAAFDAYLQYLSDPQPLAGVGDKAVQSLIGISSFKSPNKGCNIDAGGAPGSLKITGPALGKALGALCNKLFAATP